MVKILYILIKYYFLLGEISINECKDCHQDCLTCSGPL